MDERTPDFYMTSSEDSRLRHMRKCFSIKRFHALKRDDYLLIEITPPLSGDAYGIEGVQLNELLIATRHRGVSLFPIKKWPVDVYVLRILIENPREREVIRENDIVLIGWAELYNSQLDIA